MAMKRYLPDELAEVIRLHGMWRRNEDGGVRAYLSGANLSGANLSGANLSGANLSGANLSGANLRMANLIGADLSGAYLSGANMSGAYLSGANMIGANLRMANLIGADLSGADLSGANLSGADLSGANMSGADGADIALAMGMHIPPEGPFWGWKKCRGGVIVKLSIPAEAKRSHGSERKCRCEFADVLEVIGAETGESDHMPRISYRVGERVTPDAWDENRWKTCSNGIHFFLTRAEAENYNL